MGAACCKNTAQSGGGGRFVSAPREVQFKAYRWSSSTWTCEECSAVFGIREALAAEHLEGVFQVAFHNGDQEEVFLSGEAGMCPSCKVYWRRLDR